MAFSIPEKSLLSFGRTQCVDTLWRFSKQIDQHWEKKQEREKSLKVLYRYLTILASHEEKEVAEKALALKAIFPSTPEELQIFLMDLERENQIDLKDSDFLITTKDTEQRISDHLLPIHIVLDNLRSSFNVGSIFRTAEALGALKIHLCGYTPTPDNAKTKKSALGTDNWIDWTYWESSIECLESLRAQGVQTYSFETDKKAKALDSFTPQFPCAIILGNERYGLGTPILRRSTEILKISLKGKKNSLNVGTCAAIALNHLVQAYSDNH